MWTPNTFFPSINSTACCIFSFAVFIVSSDLFSTASLITCDTISLPVACLLTVEHSFFLLYFHCLLIDFFRASILNVLHCYWWKFVDANAQGSCAVKLVIQLGLCNASELQQFLLVGLVPLRFRVESH